MKLHNCAESTTSIKYSEWLEKLDKTKTVTCHAA
jgi:hypothetical protein